MFIEIVIFCVTFVIVYFLYSNYRVHNELLQKGIKYIPGLPIFGNNYASMMNQKHFLDEIIEIYNAFPHERYVALLEGSTPIIIIRDPELTRDITVKHFEHFMDHMEFFPPDADILGKGLFSMKGDRWRDMRTTLSPAFTGSKMRMMLPSMMKVAHNVVEYLKEHAGEDIDVDDTIRRYSNDVIATAGFGLQLNSFKDKNNEFFKIGQSLFKFTFWQKTVMFLYSSFSFIAKPLKLKLVPDKTSTFFRHIVTSTMEHREKNNVERPDMIQLLMEASKGKLKSTQSTKEDVGFAAVEEALAPQGEIRKWSVDDLVGQVFLFFNAGFETTASTLVLCIHELALAQDVQDKLYEEVKSFSVDNQFTYENISKLKYLDCVLNETLRKWSPAIVMDRMCVKSYELPPPREGGKPYKLKPGDVVFNMVNAIQLDEKYYPDPFKFDPERFSDENKHKIRPFTFTPFGAGPRNCIGSRFALMELKVLFYSLILNYKIQACEKTVKIPRLVPEGFLIRVDPGTIVRFLSRN